LYREAPGKDPFRPDQKTPVKNFFLAGSYTKQVKFPAFVTLFPIVTAMFVLNFILTTNYSFQNPISKLTTSEIGPFVQDYIDSMEGATLSGRQASAYICDAGEELFALREKLRAGGSEEPTLTSSSQLSFV